MPRTPTVPHDILKSVILNTQGVIDESGKVCCPSNPIWTAINERVDNKLSPKYINVFVNDNRHNIYSELLHHHGILVPSPVVESTASSSSCSVTEEESLSSDAIVTDGRILPKKTFVVKLSPEDWDIIKPVDVTTVRSGRGTTRQRMKLQDPWSDVVVKYLWDQQKLPCPYTMKRAHVFVNDSTREQYITISAKCNECGSEANGRILEEPPAGSYVELEWRANDSRDIPHDKKRQLKGKERKEVGNIHLKNSSAVMYRRHKAKELMVQGDVIPPHLHNTTVLRKAKQEKKDDDLGIVKGKGMDPLTGLMTMKHSGPYSGSIHDIGLDKVFVLYYLSNQMFLYKNYRRNEYTILSLDATGSVVQKIQRLDRLSGHIFLYQFVLHTGSDQLPVVQWLSEKHDANTILYIINEWERHGAPCPNEVVIDGSAALKSALARSFGRSASSQSYIDKLFAIAMGIDVDMPPCFIRIDVAHFLHSAKRWKLWDSKERIRLRDFYLRCLGLLINAASIDEFKALLTHILRLAMSPTESSADLLSDNSTDIDEETEKQYHCVQESRRILAEKIRGLPEFNTESLMDKEDKWYDERGVDSESNTKTCTEEDVKENKPTVRKWVGDISQQIKESVGDEKKGELNAYYCPAVATELVRLSSEFVLWSSVLVKNFKSPKVVASSASVESEFGDLKTRVLQGTFKPLRIDRFVALNLKTLEGRCFIATAPKKRNYTEKYDKNTSSTKKSKRDEHINEITVVKPKEINKETTRSDTEDDPEEIGGDGQEIPEQQLYETNSLFRPWETTSCLGFHAERTEEESNMASTSEIRQLTAPKSVETKEELTPPYNLTVKKTIQYNTVDFSETSELNYIENWRGKAKAKVAKRRSKYLNPLPQFEAAVSQNRLKQPAKRIMLNGNKIVSFIKMDKKTRVRVINTCSFDSVCQILAEMYIVDKSCREFFETSTSGLLITARRLAIDGATPGTYRARTETLVPVLQPRKIRNLSIKKAGIKKEGKRRERQKQVSEEIPEDPLGIEYSCWENVRTIVERVIGDAFSVKIEWHCQNLTCHLPKHCNMATLEPNPNIIFTDGIDAMKRGLLKTLKVTDYKETRPKEKENQFESVIINQPCSKQCGHQTTVTYRFGPFILVDVEFINTEGFGSTLTESTRHKRPYGLRELPKHLELLSVEYELIGVAAYQPGHYISFIRQTSTRWDVLDDMVEGIADCHDDEVVTPAILVYFRIQ